MLFDKIILAVILILAVPIGYLLAWITGDELKSGRKWFKVILIMSIIMFGWFALTGDMIIALTMIFIFIATFISYLKSFDKKWTKIRK